MVSLLAVMLGCSTAVWARSAEETGETGQYEEVPAASVERQMAASGHENAYLQLGVLRTEVAGQK